MFSIIKGKFEVCDAMIGLYNPSIGVFISKFSLIIKQEHFMNLFMNMEWFEFGESIIWSEFSLL